MSYNKSQLLVYDFAADEVYNYQHNLNFTCIASHPVTRCIATGDQRGLIILWCVMRACVCVVCVCVSCVCVCVCVCVSCVHVLACVLTQKVRAKQ